MTHAITFDTAAHRLLDDLDRRHDELLQELDALDRRVIAVLSQYIQVRPETAADADQTAAGLGMEVEEDDDDSED